MITAQEARLKVDQSETKMTARLELIGGAIVKAAELGKSHIWLGHSLPYDDAYKVNNMYHSGTFTPLQLLIKEALEKHPLNYKVTMVSHTAKRAGLGWNDDADETVTSEYIQVSW